VKKADPLLVVGSLAYDDLEMPHGTYENVLGGAATYSSVAASFFSPVRIVGVIGDDFSDDVLTDLRGRGVDTDGVERARGKTFRWRGRYSADLASRTTLDTQLNVFADFRPKIPASYASSPYVLLGNIHPALQLEVLAQVPKPKLVAADTMNFWIHGEPKALAEVLKKIDLLVINDEEVRDLSGCTNLLKAAREVRKNGLKRLIVKRGEHGALLFDDDGIFFVPAFPLEEVRDPTGAGDSFAGGLMGAIARHDDGTSSAIRRAMFFASALGSFCVEDVGPKRLLSMSRADLRRRIEGFVKMVDYGGDLPVEA
jgi:sugar/nucleoside kinase (ribokinase family)